MEKVKIYAEKLNGFIMPYLLCASLMSAALSIYTENVFDGYTAAAAVWMAALFALFGILRRHKYGGLLYLAAVVAAVGFMPGLFLYGYEYIDFMQWFFSGAQAIETRFDFLAVFLILFGFFFASVIFYFTQSVYRSAAMVLVSLMPFALAVKAVVTLDNKYPAVIAALNLFIFIYYSRRDFFRTAKPAGGSVIGVYGDFALAAALLAAIIPKPQTAPFYEKFEDAVNRFSFGGSGTVTMDGEYSQYSGNADEMLRGESRLLYYINTNDPVYMKIQVFDRYNSEIGHWESPGDSINGKRDWSKAARLINFEKLSAAFEAAGEVFPELYEDYPTAAAYTNITEKESYSVVYTGDFAAAYMLAPLRITDTVLSGTTARYTVRSDSGEMFTDLRRLPANANYTVRYLSEDVSDELTAAGVCDISMEDWGALLEDAVWAAEFDSEEHDVLTAFLNEYNNAYSYREKNVTPVPESIQELAEELTAGLEYDHQKAEIIEQYFQNGSFRYDLTYTAPEELDTPEYFIFESRTGTCSDFATAYTLLARAAGLTVRYTEGFTMSEGANPQPGTYYIYTENAHAYPEVYIPGAGWRIYEPTVANLNRNGSESDTGGNTDYTAAVLTAIIVLIGMGLFVLFLLMLPRITETMFVLSLCLADNGKAVRRLYIRHGERLGLKLNADPLPMTPEETAELTEGMTGISLKPLTMPLTESCYGGRDVTREERKAAYQCYREQRKALGKKKKKRKRG